jgi:hypothetical protein
MILKHSKSFQKFMVLLVLSSISSVACQKDETQNADSDESSAASIAGDVAGALQNILRRYGDDAADMVAHNADDVAKIAAKTRSLGLVGKYGSAVHNVYRQTAAASKTALGQLLPKTGDLPFVHHWDDTAARIHHAMEDVTNGTARIDGGQAGKDLIAKVNAGKANADEMTRALNLIKYTIPAKNTPALLSKTATVNDKGELFLNIGALATKSFSKDEILRLAKSGAFGEGGTHEIIWVAMKGDQINAGSPGVANMVMAVSQKARSAAAYADETKTQHLWLISYLRNGEVTLSNARVAGAGQVKLGGVAKLGGEDVVKVNGFNMCSGHTRPPLKVVGAFVTALVSMVGASNFKVEGAGKGICY